jgi:pimeloyl-ACP methyl ester carboxylesterase
MESNTSVVDGIRMPWEERGTGTPVILLHGIPTSPALWRHVAPKLDARVLAWEIVGYGESIVQGRGRDTSRSSARRSTCWPGSSTRRR